MNGEPDLGEQALSKVAEVAISSQLDEVEEINVDIRTDPLKLMQGKVDSVSIAGEGMVVQQDLRVEAVEVTTGAVAINPMSAVFGQIELTQPADAQAYVVLTEQDLNRALASSYLREKMQDLAIQLHGKSLTVALQQAELHLPGEGKLEINAQMLIRETGEMKQFSAIAIPTVQDNGQRIDLEILSAEGEGLSVDLMSALFLDIVELLDLRNFDLGGMTLQLHELAIQPGKLLLKTTTTIEQFPT